MDFPLAHFPSPKKQFPFKGKTTPNRHLDHTIIPNSNCASTNSLENFSNKRVFALFLFCRVNFKNPFFQTTLFHLAKRKRPSDFIPTSPLKAGYTAHSNFFTAMQVYSQKVPSYLKPPVWVSTKSGFASVCRYSAPKNLNFQHKPRFGQPKPTQETSQMCHLTLLTSSKQFHLTRILRLHKYYTIKQKKMQLQFLAIKKTATICGFY